ncbi:hypothetical protein ACFX1X_012724 [Malus domestica]
MSAPAPSTNTTSPPPPTALAPSAPTPPSSTAPPPSTSSAPPPTTLCSTCHQPRCHHRQNTSVRTRAKMNQMTRQRHL